MIVADACRSEHRARGVGGSFVADDGWGYSSSIITLQHTSSSRRDCSFKVDSPSEIRTIQYIDLLLPAAYSRVDAVLDLACFNTEMSD